MREAKMLDEKTKELIAVGASVACNCHPCVLFHTAKARELNMDDELIKQATEVGRMVRKGAADQMDKLMSGCSKD
jgi:AhpD family alkylhydroperoxidase